MHLSLIISFGIFTLRSGCSVHMCISAIVVVCMCNSCKHHRCSHSSIRPGDCPSYHRLLSMYVTLLLLHQLLTGVSFCKIHCYSDKCHTNKLFVFIMITMKAAAGSCSVICVRRVWAVCNIVLQRTI